MRPCKKVLRSLSGDDHFNLLMFNSKVTAFQPALSGATPVSLQKATDFVRSSRLRGGTDLQRTLEAGLAQCVTGSANNYLVLLTDGSATRGSIVSGKLSAWYAEKREGAAGRLSSRKLSCLCRGRRRRDQSRCRAMPFPRNANDGPALENVRPFHRTCI
jgi:hypothetical protein